MIVVDTNTIAYLYLPSEFTNDVETLLDKESHWIAPVLWRSEFRNILSLYIRKDIIDLETALQIQSEAENLLAGNEYAVNSSSVLALAQKSGCSACDCEFVSLAKSANVKLVTADKKILTTFPGIALKPKQFIRTK